MDIDKAKQLVESAKQQEDDLQKAKELVELEKQKELQRQKQLENERRIKQQKEFDAKLPPEFSNVYSTCWKCKKKIEFSNDPFTTMQSRLQGEAIVRIAECSKCGCYNLEYANASHPKGQNEKFRGIIHKLLTQK